MVYSMTGYGRASSPSNSSINFTAEIKTVNSKYLDCRFRMPSRLAFLEKDMISLIKSNLNRGYIDISIRILEDSGDNYNIIVNHDLVEKYSAAYKQIMQQVGLSKPRISDFLNAEDLLIVERDIKNTDQYREELLPVLQSAVDSVLKMRRSEGEKLKEDLIRRLDRIGVILAELKELGPQLLQIYQDKFEKRISSLVANHGSKIEPSILANEIAIHADKTDIAEEIVRIEAHIGQSLDFLNSDDDKPVGKSLEFLAQELLREANTIASKSQSADISARVIEMKTLIDQIKEQVLNIV